MLNQLDINNIINTIVIGYDPEKIILFGSYAKGNPNENSDIDILIISKTDTPYTQRPRSIRRLFNPYPAPMDILVYTPDEFDKYSQMINGITYFANKEGKVVYERPL